MRYVKYVIYTLLVLFFSYNILGMAAGYLSIAGMSESFICISQLNMLITAAITMLIMLGMLISKVNQLLVKLGVRDREDE